MSEYVSENHWMVQALEQARANATADERERVKKLAVEIVRKHRMNVDDIIREIEAIK